MEPQDDDYDFEDFEDFDPDEPWYMDPIYGRDGEPIYALEIAPSIPYNEQLGITSQTPRDFPEPVEPILLAEMIQDQAADEECQRFATDAGLSSSIFDFNQDGLLVRKSKCDGAIQTVISRVLRERVLRLSPKPIT